AVNSHDGWMSCHVNPLSLPAGSPMIEIIFFGRGGQGAVTAAQVLATAAFKEGKYAQAFPSFGPERRGAPVTAYARIDEDRILVRSNIIKADYVLVLDPNIFKTSNPLESVKAHGTAILNAGGAEVQIRDDEACKSVRVCRLDASRISEDVYGRRPIPMTNIAMLGAFAAVSKVVRLDSIVLAADGFFSAEQAEKAKKTARVAFEEIEGAESL
ncbi:MAG: 2-oxoacid:acceptor oxidoreductase family protein, partial [Pseudomonadota bacterium]